MPLTERSDMNYVGRGLAPAATPKHLNPVEGVAHLRVLLYSHKGDHYGKLLTKKKASAPRPL